MNSISELMGLNGRTALVTGATGVIGREIASTIAELKGDLILVDRPGSVYTDLIKLLKDINGQCSATVIDCDLESSNSRKNLAKSLNQKNINIDILVNNAAFVADTKLDGWVTSFEKQSVETWERAINVNLTAVFDLSKLLMSKYNSKVHIGSIINIASIYGILGPDYSLYSGTSMGNPAAYAASKGGVVQLTRWMSTTLAPKVRVNTISPGGLFREQPSEFVKRYEDRTPMARMANPADFKGAVAFLSSDLSAYVTGHNLIVDGGWSVW